MDQDLLDDIYLSLSGQLVPECALSWVPNMFLPDSTCDKEYEQMRDAYVRLCSRLGTGDTEEDPDLNCFVTSLEHIQEILCKKMFELGMDYAQTIL